MQDQTASEPLRRAEQHGQGQTGQTGINQGHTMIPCSWCPQWERASRSSRAQKRRSGRHCEEKERRREAGEEFRSWDSTQNWNKKAFTATVPIATERCHHHVRGVQRVDEVWWESVLLFNCVRLPEKGQQSPNVATDVGSCKNERWTSVEPSRI